MNKRGFTLIEILVVISIVAILTTVSISVFSTLQKNNRDQIRLRALQSIKQALELYRSDNGNYPDDANNDFPNGINRKYLTNWPTDPVVGQYYIYAKISTDEFIVCAKKEGNMTGNTPADCPSYSCKKFTSCDIGLQSD